MLLQWLIDSKTYHFYDLYRMKGSCICVDLMVDKDTNMITDNSLLITNKPYKKFPGIKNMELQRGKRLILDCVLANSDHLIFETLRMNLNHEVLKQDILNFTETFIQYKIREGLDRENGDPKKCDVHNASVLTNDLLAPDEKKL